MKITAADIAELHTAEYHDLAVLSRDGDRFLVEPQSTAAAHGHQVVCDATAVETWSGGQDMTDEDYAQFAAELTDGYGNLHYLGGDAVLVGDTYVTPAEAAEYARAESEALEALGAPPDSCEGEGDDPVQREGEHDDDYNVRREEWMFGPQDADLDEEE